MGIFEVLLVAVGLVEILFTLNIHKNLHYARKHYRRPRAYQPSCLLIIPCKGLDENFERNILSFYKQSYKGYRLWFVVEDISDPAYAELQRLKNQYTEQSQSADIQILIAGYTDGCSQKLHNLLFACHKAPPDIEVFAFADSDALAGSDWLRQLVWPLERAEIGLSSGYRCFVPRRNNPATLALSSMNAKVCQLLGGKRFNLAWGGSMAVRKEDFERLKIAQIWSRALSDDLSISKAVKEANLETQFVPGCVVASYKSTTWRRLWEFARRQFVITRIYAPGTWLFGLFGTLWSVAWLWGGLALAIWALATGIDKWPFYVAFAAIVLGCQIVRAIMRQILAAVLLTDERDALLISRWADLLGFWASGLLMLAVIIASSFGRTITWRGIRYRIKSPTDIEIIEQAPTSG